MRSSCCCGIDSIRTYTPSFSTAFTARPRTGTFTKRPAGLHRAASAVHLRGCRCPGDGTHPHSRAPGTARLHPLAYPEPEQLVRLVDDLPGAGAHDVGMSVPE